MVLSWLCLFGIIILSSLSTLGKHENLITETDEDGDSASTITFEPVSAEFCVQDDNRLLFRFHQSANQVDFFPFGPPFGENGTSIYDKPVHAPSSKF